MRLIRSLCVGAVLALAASAAQAQNQTRVGLLSCDVSRGVGLFVVEKQMLNCTYTAERSGRVDHYTGSIDQYGVALGTVDAGHLVWAVLAVTDGPGKGALAGTYVGAGANASLGVGGGVNVLVGGLDRSFSLQPVSVEGQKGINIAGGVTHVTLRASD